MLDDLVYGRTRNEAIEKLATFIIRELDKNHRVLIGFDFPFGYPKGVAEFLTGQACAQSLWDWLHNCIWDAGNNNNNRYDVAAKVNRKFSGLGPFWGRPKSWPYPDIPTRKNDRTCRGTHPREHRITDFRAKGAKTVWQLYGAGSVGSQALLGIPQLKRLIGRPHIKEHAIIWPFQTGLCLPDVDKRLVLAEVYPSLLKQEIKRRTFKNEIPDRAQVRVTAEAFALLDKSGGLAPLFRCSSDLNTRDRTIVETEEGWILGVGHDVALRHALNQC